MHMRTKQHGNNLTTWFVRIQVNEARENMGSQKKTKKVSLACCDWLRFSYGFSRCFLVKQELYIVGRLLIFYHVDYRRP